MNAIIASLSELVKMLADSFRLPTLFPSLFFIILNQLFIIPHFKFLPVVNELTKCDLKDQALISGVLAVLFGYTINAIEVPIIRFYEGYPWKNSRMGQFLTGWQLGRRDQLQNQRSSELNDSFPNPARVLPTKLGNIIAAFEAYPERRYGMDGVTFWPRLFPILVKYEFASYVLEHRSTLDFLLNTSLLAGAFGFECILLRIFFLPNISWALPLVSLTAAFIFYQAAISSAYDWGEMFRVAFDLFRYQLAEALGLKPVGSFADEYTLWDKLTRFWMLQPKVTFNDFAHASDTWPIDNSQSGQNKENDK